MPITFVTVELGAFYADDVQFQGVSERPHLLNRWPEPDSEGVPQGSHVALELVDVGPDGVDLAATQVYVEGVLAFDGGAFQAGFQGADSAYSTPFADVLRVVIDPESDFESLQVVTVRVVSDVVGGGSPFDQSYDFTIEDLTAPIPTSATPKELRRVRLTFDEPVVQLDAEAANDALNPGNYSFDSATVPHATITAESVDSVSPTAVDVWLDVDMTPNALYTATHSGIEDLFGNAVAPPNHQVSFYGFAPDVPTGRRFILWELIPQINRDEDSAIGDLRKFVDCLQEVLDVGMLYEVDRLGTIIDPDLAPEGFLDAMLDDMGNPFQFDLDETQKRTLLSVLIPAYQQKGTAVGIINLVRLFLGIEVEITEYNNDVLGLGLWELGVDWELALGRQRELYTFDVVSPVDLTDEQRRQIREIAVYMKPAHTHLGQIVEPATAPAEPDHWEIGLSELGSSSDLH